MILYTKVGTISGNTGGVMTTVLGAKRDFRQEHTTGLPGQARQVVAAALQDGTG